MANCLQRGQRLNLNNRENVADWKTDWLGLFQFQGAPARKVTSPSAPGALLLKKMPATEPVSLDTTDDIGITGGKTGHENDFCFIIRA